MPQEKVVAAVVRLLDSSSIRVGNAEYAQENASFGLTTMRQRHVDVRGERIRFRFRGKGGKEHEASVIDRRLAALVRRCQELPGQELFRYLDEAGEPHTVESDHVNDYLRETTGEDFTAKDFRTWAGTVLAAAELSRLGPYESETQAKANLVEAVRSVPVTLGNTEAICRKCHVHPAVVDSYLAGRMIETCRKLNHKCETAVLRLLVRLAKAA